MNKGGKMPLCIDCNKNEDTFNGRCWGCYKKHEDEFEKEYAVKEGRTRQEGRVICPYCGNIDMDDVWEIPDGNGAYQCPECEKECDIYTEYERYYETSVKEREEDDLGDE